MKIKIFILIVALLGIGIQNDSALLFFQQITRANMKDFSGTFQIRCDNREMENTSLKSFHIVVVTHQGLSKSNLTGYLEVNLGSKSVAACLVHPQNLNHSKTGVTDSVKDGYVTFEFLVAPDYVTSSKFSVQFYLSDGTESSECWFYLRDFCEK